MSSDQARRDESENVVEKLLREGSAFFNLAHLKSDEKKKKFLRNSLFSSEFGAIISLVPNF